MHEVSSSPQLAANSIVPCTELAAEKYYERVKIDPPFANSAYDSG
jgi:hypothetical protein